MADEEAEAGATENMREEIMASGDEAVVAGGQGRGG